MEVQIAVAKVNKYATSESGDTLEVVERPGGGLSVVLADGQRSGKSAKRISNLVVRKVISLLAEGVRDGAAARAASDYLYHERHGQVVSTLNILSLDMTSKSLVVSRNNPAPVLIVKGDRLDRLDGESQPIGIHRHTRPVIHEVQLHRGLAVLAFTDGLIHAGDRLGQSMDLENRFLELVREHPNAAQKAADRLLDEAVALDQGRPADDISVVVLQVNDTQGDNVRRLSVRLPLGPGSVR